jgi:Dolichyl-phosphate-mannose-protein mannosyltransferase
MRMSASWWAEAIGGMVSRPRPALHYLGYCGFFGAICVLIQLVIGAYGSDHAQAGDEAQYFVTSLMIAHYVGGHTFSNPMTFAQGYYAHFPEVGLGHYPPMFQIVEAAAFLVFGQPSLTAGALQALIGGLCAGLPAAIIGRAFGAVAGIFAGVAVLASPYLLFLIGTDMADNFLAVLVTLAALSWGRFYKLRTWPSAILFSSFAAAAILTKGTALGLALVPIIHLAFKRDLMFLFNRKTLVSALIVAVPVIPWYLFTYKLAAAGFVYSWGLGYTTIAGPFFLRAVIGSVGVPLAALYVGALYLSAVERECKDGIDIHAFVAASLSMIIFPMFAPADLTERYVIPAVPSVVVVALWGLGRLMNAAPIPNTKRFVSPILCAAVVTVSAASIYKAPHVEPFHSDQIAAYVLRAKERNPMVLVSGSTALEGAVVASFAEKDRFVTHYIVRGLEVLSSGNFMGSKYDERFKSSASMAEWIKKNEIGWIIVTRSGSPNEFAHTRILREALQSSLLQASLAFSVHNSRGEDLDLYALPAVNTLPSPTDDIFSELKPSHSL